MKLHSITIDPTNNPAIVKFTSNQLLTQGGSFQYDNIDTAKDSPLAQQLFHLPFVSKVFISTNFVAIERFDTVDWKDIEEDLKELITVYLNEGNPVVLENAKVQKIIAEVYAESTPNPNVMKFGCNRLLSQTDFEYKNAAQAKNAPLALELFQWDWVREIYIAENYISITKKEHCIWEAGIINEGKNLYQRIFRSRKINCRSFKKPRKKYPAPSVFKRFVRN